MIQITFFIHARKLRRLVFRSLTRSTELTLIFNRLRNIDANVWFMYHTQYPIRDIQHSDSD